MPGVTSVTASLMPILSGNSWGSSVHVQGFEEDADTNTGSRFNEVGPGYFSTMGIPLVAGREFTADDLVGTAKKVIVNEVFAEKFNLGRDACGKFMAVSSSGEELDMEIVGLVKNAKYNEVKGQVPPLFFTPYRQDEELGFITFYVRTAMAPEEILQSASAVIARLDPNLPVEELKTMPQQVRESVFADRIISTLSAAFAVLATILAAVGLYGVLAFTVAQRTREIGLRMALGADGGRVRRMVMAQVGWMTLIGAAVGVVAAIGLGTAARSQLFEIEAYDPVVVAVSTLVLAVVALMAGLVPAYRASRVEPMRALHYE